MTERKRGLRELGDRHDVVAGAVGGQLGIGHLEVQDAVHLQLGVVLGDTDLAGHIERHFLEHVLVGDAVDERDDDIQAGRQRGMETPETFHHPGILLRHDLECLDDEDDGGKQYEQGDFHVFSLLLL